MSKKFLVKKFFGKKMFEWYGTKHACVLHLGRSGLYTTLSKVVLFIQMLPQSLKVNINQDWLFSTGWVYSKCLYSALLAKQLFKNLVSGPLFTQLVQSNQSSSLPPSRLPELPCLPVFWNFLSDLSNQKLDFDGIIFNIYQQLKLSLCIF